MIEHTIMSNLMDNEAYCRKVLPFIKRDYFDAPEHKAVFDCILRHVEKYGSMPTPAAIRIRLDDMPDMKEKIYEDSVQFLTSLKVEKKTDPVWLVDETERFCQDQALHNAVRDSILILDGEKKGVDRGSIPGLLTDALAVSFDNRIGHEFLEDFSQRYDAYHTVEDKIAFGLDIFDQITKGGVSRKALVIALAGTGVGKTLFMCHTAASMMMAGKNVLYITMEMAEEKIAERIDANLMDVTVDDIHVMTRNEYVSKMDRIRSRTTGKLFIKEYPTASAGANHFRFLLNELKIKKNFKPDVIFVDYLNICLSSRIKMGAGVNSYTYIKAIAEELRGLGVEFNVPVISATQTTRSGYSNTDVSLEDTSESFGLPATADFMFALISTEELEALGQILVKQLKNRWGGTSSPRRFIIGVDRARMKLYNAENSAQEEFAMLDDKPSKKTGKSEKKSDSVMDNTTFGERDVGDDDLWGGNLRRGNSRRSARFDDF